MCKTQSRPTSICRTCGKPIRFIKGQNGKVTPVEPNGSFFLPMDSGEAFITADGQEQLGRLAPDGLRGYKKHNCGFERRVMTEKEFAKRCYY